MVTARDPTGSVPPQQKSRASFKPGKLRLRGAECLPVWEGVSLTQDVGHGLHQILLVSAVTGAGGLLGQHEAAQDGVGLVQEEVQHLQAGGDPLGQRSTDDHVVGT